MPNATTNVRSKRSSRGVAARCSSPGSRPDMRATLWTRGDGMRARREYPGPACPVRLAPTAVAVDLVIDIENAPGALAEVAAAISDAGVNIAAATCIGGGERA